MLFSLLKKYHHRLISDNLKTKIAIRNELKEKLALLSDSKIQELSQDLSQKLNLLLNELDVIEKKQRIGVFSPIKQEPLWYLRIDEAKLAKLAFPATMASEMVFKASKPENLELSNEFGTPILAPTSECEIVVPEIIIVPGLGFTKAGERIGRGKGYYDRYLVNKKAIVIGVAFEDQLVDELPTDAHDVKMNFVVTDREIYRNNLKEF